MTETLTLGEAYPREQERLRDLLVIYASIGPAGTFASILIKDCLARADQAAMEGDTIAMIRVYEEMKEFSA